MEFSNDFYNTFVPNYKTLASIAQVFSTKLSPKNSVILETQILNHMTRPTLEERGAEQSIDPLIVQTFVKKFNDKYEAGLLEEQKALLNYYISSFSDNSLTLKAFLNEEIPRLKKGLQEALLVDEIKQDEDMTHKTHQIIEKLESFYQVNLNEKVLLTILKTQKLVKEFANDGDHG